MGMFFVPTMALFDDVGVKEQAQIVLYFQGLKSEPFISKYPVVRCAFCRQRPELFGGDCLTNLCMFQALEHTVCLYKLKRVNLKSAFLV